MSKLIISVSSGAASAHLVVLGDLGLQFLTVLDFLYHPFLLDHLNIARKKSVCVLQNKQTKLIYVNIC